MKKIFWILMGMALLALGASFFVEHVMGIRPCTLCRLQRIPYFSIGGLALFGLFFKWKRGIIRLIQVCLLAGLILATYHTCIQFGIISSPCQKKQTKQAGPSWRILGLPPPLFNGVFSLVVLVGTEVFLIRFRSSKR